MAQTLQEQQATRADQIDLNRELGVVDYRSGEKQSDQVYEVIEGYKHLPGGIRLGPGQRFRPTERQVANGSLRGKARELSRSEYRNIQRDERRPVSTGADFREMGLRSIEMADGTRAAAYDGGLGAEDFEGIEPGFEGRYTRAQVEELIEAKQQAGQQAESGSSDAA